MAEYTIKTPTESIITRTIVEQVTLRDQFAMAALTGFMASGDAAIGNDGPIAKLAYRFADAMLEARREKK